MPVDRYAQVVEMNRQLAAWLVSQRGLLDRALHERLGTGLPTRSSPEAEALRRLRSFAVLCLASDPKAQPSLEGLRVRERKMGPLLEAWLEAASDAAGPDRDLVRFGLEPVVDRFRENLRSTASAVRASGAPRKSKRRAVSAAIDRVADAFLAIDPDSGDIADANPAAGAMLGTTRDALIGSAAQEFVSHENQERWWTELEAIAEGGDPRRFLCSLRDAQGRDLPIEASISRFATRNRTLALMMARPTR